jgi:tetratricopeptide (TPR) repeat protein
MNLEDLLKQTTELMAQDKMSEAKATLEKGRVQFPNEAQLTFLFAAVNAQQQSYDVAIAHYQLSLQQNPTMHIARFQLGLLLATLGKVTESVTTLEPLASLGDHYLSHFANSIIAILSEQLESAKVHLDAGLSVNHENPSLNNDMKAMLARVESSLAPVDTQESIIGFENESDTDNSHLLDIYHSKH